MEQLYVVVGDNNGVCTVLEKGNLQTCERFVVEHPEIFRKYEVITIPEIERFAASASYLH